MCRCGSMIGKFGSLWIYLQTVQAYLMMPFAGIFFAGILWKRTTTQGVIACLITAAIVCPLLMANGQWMSAGHEPFLPFMGHPLLRPWLHAACVGFLICMVVLVAASLLSPPVTAEKLRSTTVSNWKALLAPGGGGLHRNYLLWLGLLLTICSALWYAMR